MRAPSSNPRRRTTAWCRALRRPWLLLLLAVLPGCSPDERAGPADATPPEIVASIGSARITAAEFLAERARHTAALSDRELLDRLVRERLLLQEAARTGFDQSAELKAAWTRLVATRMEASLLADLPAPEPTEAELEAYHREHAGRYSTVERVHASILQLQLPGEGAVDARQEALARAERLRLESGASAEAFARVATEHSRHPGTRRRGGDLGWLTRTGAQQELPAAVVDQLFSVTAVDTVSPVLVTPEGLFLVRLHERRPAQLRPLDQVRERVRHEVRQSLVSAAEARVLATLRERHPVQVHADRLAALAQPEPAAAVAAHPPQLPAR